MAKKKKPTKICVPLPHCGGMLVAEKMGDLDYPGIAVYFKYDNGPELDVTITEVPIEMENGKKEINTYHYGDPSQDDWTTKLQIEIPPKE